MNKFFIATIMTVLTSSAILSGGMNISQATTSSEEDIRAQQQERRQQQQEQRQQQQEQQQNLQTQAVQTQALSEKKPITTADIADNAITSPKIKDSEVKTLDIANGAVTKEKLNPNAVKLVLVIRSSETIRFEPGNVRVQFGVSCNSDEVLTGGGYSSNAVTGSIDVNLMDAQGQTWVMNVGNSGTVPFVLTAKAYCTHLELGP